RVAVGRDVADAAPEHAPRAVVGDVAAPEQDAALARVAQTHDRLDQLVLPVALDAGHADDLASADVQADVVHREMAAVVLDDQPLQAQDRLAGVGLAL